MIVSTFFACLSNGRIANNLPAGLVTQLIELFLLQNVMHVAEHRSSLPVQLLVGPVKVVLSRGLHRFAVLAP